MIDNFHTGALLNFVTQRRFSNYTVLKPTELVVGLTKQVMPTFFGQKSRSVTLRTVQLTKRRQNYKILYISEYSEDCSVIYQKQKSI